MKKLAFLMVCCVAFPALALSQAGQVVDFRGEAFITPKGAAPKAVSLKQAVQVGDTIETKTAGSVKILFVDDTVLTLKENSKTIITTFLFDAKGKKRKSVFNVLVGKVRTTVGKYFGDDQTVEIKTPTAMAGIRGTDVGALVKAKLTTFFCFDGKFESYNLDFPDRVVTVTEGFGIEIMEGMPASPEDLAPIPSDVQERSYDISLTTKPEGKEIGKEAPPASAGQQAVQSTSSAVAVETAQATAPAATTETSALESVAQAQSQTETTTTSLPSDSTTSGKETLPGGSTESTTTTTETTDVKITFP